VAVPEVLAGRAGGEISLRHARFKGEGRHSEAKVPQEARIKRRGRGPGRGRRQAGSDTGKELGRRERVVKIY